MLETLVRIKHQRTECGYHDTTLGHPDTHMLSNKYILIKARITFSTTETPRREGAKKFGRDLMIVIPTNPQKSQE